jgi:glycosyltransferase involved in cell wall biosynthesis
VRRYQIIVLQDTLRPGGTERQSLWLTRTLPNARYAARLLLFQTPPAAELVPPDIEVESLQSHRLPLPWYGPGLIRRLRLLRADVVICMGRNANSYAAWIRACLPGLVVISTCRTSRPLPFFYRLGVARSHHCVSNTAWAARRLVASGIKGEAEVTTLPNALLRPELLTLDRSPPARAAARDALGLPRDRPVVVNVASFVPGKNKQGLLRAFAQSSGAEAAGALLLLVGGGAELAACQRLARSLELADRVRFWGHTEGIGPILQASDLFVSTALRDALPNALVEAQAAGLPVVAYDTGGATEAFIDGQSGWSVPSGDEAAFAQALDAQLSSSENQTAFSMAARRQAAERFCPETVAARYHTLIHKLLER